VSRRFGPFELGEESTAGSIIAGRIGVPSDYSSSDLEDDSSVNCQSSSADKLIEFPFTPVEEDPANQNKVIYLQVPQARIANDDAKVDVNDMGPERNYGCPYYETCLSTAAALNWDSFSCTGCKGQVNKQLLWKAHSEVKKNSTLQKLCKLPILQ
jgi:hypothetical protein